jgi:hypothetical protein
MLRSGWFWLIIGLLIFAPGVLIAFFNLIGPLLTTAATNAQHVANNLHH